MPSRPRTVLLIGTLVAFLLPVVAGAATKKLTDAQIFAILAAANSGEIEAANLAQEKSGNADVKAFADNMIKDHTQMQTEAHTLASKLDTLPKDSPLSTQLKAGAEKEMVKLRSVQGPAFDKAYVSAQVADHTKVLNLFDNKLIPHATSEELKTMLKQARPTIAEHLKHARALQAQLRKGVKTTMSDSP